MRFREFKILLESNETRKIYAVGDSHADAGGISSYKGVINRAQGGQPSTARYNYEGSHKTTGEPTGINTIPPNQIVIISQGANDTANSMRAHMDSKGKTKLVPPATIASNVAALVNAAKAKGHIVVFILFPNGPGRGSGLAKYYGGDYQEEVRSAIRSAVGVPVVDLDGKGLAPDGIHSTGSAYMSAAKEAIDIARRQSGGGIKQSGKTETPPAAAAPAPKTDKPSDNNFSIYIPTTSLGWKGPEIMNVQKALVALGYDVGPPGIDGIRGKYTIAAIKKYQSDRGLKVDGDPGPETVTALNKDIRSAPEKFSSVEKSKPNDVKQSARVGRQVSRTPVAYDAVTKGKIGEVLNFVAAPESRGYYDMMNGSVRKPEILTMTLNQANKFQQAWARTTGNSSAMGRYQIMGNNPNNTVDYGRKAGFDLDKDLFSPENQDKMAIIFMQEKGLDQWLAGKMSDEQFLEGLSQVWAALPSPSKGGNSFYGGVGTNPYKTSVKMGSAIDTLQNIRQA